jgi:NRPS condensation-like uncharacterized protein
MESGVTFSSDSKEDIPPIPSPDKRASVSEPRTPIERAVHGIWQSLLNREQIDVNEDFFTAGGTSEIADSLVEQLCGVFLLNLSVDCLFTNPTISGQAACIEQARASTKRKNPAIVPAPRSDRMALSFSQQRLWFFDQLVPGSPLYNNTLAIHITGPINLFILERSLNELIRRHEALRTVFKSDQGQAFQVILPSLTIPLPQVDLQALLPDQRQERTDELYQEESQQPFDLQNGPLIRAKILKLEPEKSIFFLTIHHIICDGWSVGIITSEINTLYSAYANQQVSPLPELPIQYVDFSHWQHQRLQGELLENLVRFWQKELADTPTSLNLLTDRPRPAAASFRGDFYDFSLPASLVLELKQQSRSHGSTLFMILLAAFFTLMYQYSGQEKFCIGSPIANRTRAEFETLIGLFINMLALRADLSGAPTFEDLLQQVKETTNQAYAHQDLPFELLVEKLRPKRSPNRTPFFQVMFILENFKLNPLMLPGLDTQLSDINTHTAKFDLSLYVLEQSNGSLTCKMEYSTDLYETETIAQMCSLYQAILEEVVEDPRRQILEILQSALNVNVSSHKGDYSNKLLNSTDDEREDFLI